MWTDAEKLLRCAVLPIQYIRQTIRPEAAFNVNGISVPASEATLEYGVESKSKDR